MAKARLSFAEQIAQLEEPAPVDVDPEDALAAGFSPEDDAETAVNQSAAREHYLDVGPSQLRKLHDSVSDPKYKGAKVSRKDLAEAYEQDSEFEDEEARNDDGGDDIEHSDDLDGEDAQEDSRESDRDPSESNQEAESDNYPDPRPQTQDEADPNEEMASNLRMMREEERKKGKAVSRQIRIWDSLMDARIRIQKSMAAAARLPPATILSQHLSSNNVQPALNQMLDEALRLSDELSDLQEALLLKNESIQPPPRKRRKTDIEFPGEAIDFKIQLSQATEDASAFEHAFHPHLIQTLDKWSSKVQAIAPSVLLPSNRNAFNKSSQHLKSATQLIDETLSEHSKILSRTQIYRGKGKRLCVDDEQKEDSELFDDTDFYQQLLRDIIDARGHGASGEEDWMLVQKQKKTKKKVDTKASKGRKLRYEVHEKLQNFMVPVSVQGSWHEEQIDELFASVMGKGFKHATDIAQDAEERDIEANKVLETEISSALKGGFRIFG